MTLDDAFPSKYMKASDLPEEGSVTLTIDKVTIEEIGKEKQEKPVIHFKDHDKGRSIRRDGRGNQSPDQDCTC